jgi:hypothetical protein
MTVQQCDRDAELADELEQWIRGGSLWGISVPKSLAERILAALRDRLAAEQRMKERCAEVAAWGCMVPPDGGSPTDAERELCDSIAQAIRALP